MGGGIKLSKGNFLGSWGYILKKMRWEDGERKERREGEEEEGRKEGRYFIKSEC